MTTIGSVLVLSLLALAFGGSLWAAWRMRWERDRARNQPDVARVRFAELVEHVGQGGGCSDECCMHGSAEQRADTAHACRPLDDDPPESA